MAPAAGRKATSDIELLGDVGILFADLSGYSQLLYQCIDREDALRGLALAVSRLFGALPDDVPELRVEGYAGDGFLAFVGGKTPARSAYDFARELHRRFAKDVRPGLLNLGFRVAIALRTGLHFGRVWRVALPGEKQQGHRLNISDAINVASRVVTSQTCRRAGLAVTKSFYRRLLLAGGEEIREPDEVIQDRNQYPEPIDIYRIKAEDEEKIRQVKNG
jgi:class 3 adenylate cyclase